MVFRDSGRLLTLAALLCTAMPSFASELPQSVQPGSCVRPDYPEKAQKAEEEGISVLGFLLRADGTVERSVVLNSSGSRYLDREAEQALSRCVFKRDADSGGATGHWIRITYVWSFTDDPSLLRATRATAIAAGKGSLPARYHLSLILWATAKTDADREKAIVVLHSAAQLGHAHAQFELGRRFEKGDGVEMNLLDALRWYQKSAAQDDPFAKQRLALGKLSD